MYKIGEFAKIVDSSVKTIRYYDDINLLPANVDEFSGYRYYTDENIAEYQFIMLLKSVGFRLDQIALLKNNLTSDIIDEQIDVKRQEIEDAALAIKKLEIIKEELTNNKTNDNVVVLSRKLNNNNKVA